MRLRTEIKIIPSSGKVHYSDQLFCIGSCFTEHIHQKLLNGFFNSHSNPCGIVYNPASIADQVDRIVNQTWFTSDDLIQDHELFHGLFHHGDFSSLDEQEALQKMNHALSLAYQKMIQSKWILITLGTSIVYRHIEKNKIVANCHKIPGHQFHRFFLEVDEMVRRLSTMMEGIDKLLPGIHLIFTISPIRYLSEGFTENSRSKARLILAIETICKVFPQATYFPAYEIVLDDLRDYRFYKEDLIHPNDQAVQYIWEKFMDTYFDEETARVWNEMNKLNNEKNHRSLHPDTLAHKKFTSLLEGKLNAARRSYPELNL